MDLEGRTIVFVGGLHRSGTTVLARNLGRHPEASGFFDTGAQKDEGQWVQSVFPTEVDWGGPGLFAFDPRAHWTEASEWAAPEHRDRVLAQWAAHWDLERRYLVEKTPSNLIKGRFLRALAPGCFLVFMTRHPLVTALATQRWAEVSVPLLIEHWLRAHEIMVEDLRGLDRFVVLKYEAFAAAPQRWFEALCDAIGMPAAALSEPLRPDLNRQYEATMAGDWGTVTRYGPGRRALYRLARRRAKQLKIVLRRAGFAVDRLAVERPYLERLYGDRARRFGYDMADLAALEAPFVTAETLDELAV